MPSRTDVSLISSLVSLFEESPRNILGRAIVIHQLPDDRARISNAEAENRFVACGLLTTSEVEDVTSIESTIVEGQKRFNTDKIEQRILNGEQSWENVNHPHYGGDAKKVPSNLNLEGIERPVSVDRLTLETAAPTRKGNTAFHWYKA
jgi:hypothetical protein